MSDARPLLADPAGVFSNLYGQDPGLTSAINDIKPFRMSTYTSSGLQRPNNNHDWSTFQYLYNGGQIGQNIWQEAPNGALPSILGYYAANDVSVRCYLNVTSAFSAG
jgi:hypothetical protein